MGSTHQEAVRVSMVRGMHRAPKPFQVPEDRWYLTNGMRFSRGEVRMVPRRTVQTELTPGYAHPLLAVEVIPVGERNACLVLGLTPNGVWQLSTGTAHKPLLLDETIAPFDLPAKYTRWSTTHYNRRLLFVNEYNAVRATDGTRIYSFGTDAPKGRYVEVFFDHVVIGAPVWRGVDSPADVRWSHLYNFAQWEKGTDSEADHYTFAESLLVGGDGPLGVTGMKRVGETLFVHTATSISALRYVGLPLVMRVIEGLVPDRGCGFRYGLAMAERMQYFPDRYAKTFYQFDGQSVRDIGLPIKDYFWATLSTDFNLQQRTYTYTDPLHSEVHWVYISTASAGPYDLEVVYNYRDEVWWAAPVEDVQSFSPGGVRARRIDEESTLVDSTTETLEAMSQTTELFSRVWGSSFGRVLREAGTSDVLATLIARPLPSLETGDLIYGSLLSQKDVNSMVIHSLLEASAEGLSVEYTHERWHVDDTFNWIMCPELWIPTAPARRLSFKSTGRVHRFRFTPKPLVTATAVTTVQPPTFTEAEVSIARIDVAPDLCAIIGLTDGGGDNFDCYADGVLVHGLAMGTFFAAPWVVQVNWIAIHDIEDFESYTDDIALHGGNGGYLWPSAWVDRENWFHLNDVDTFQSYADDVVLAALAGGAEWAGAWVDITISS